MRAMADEPGFALFVSFVDAATLQPLIGDDEDRAALQRLHDTVGAIDTAAGLCLVAGSTDVTVTCDGERRAGLLRWLRSATGEAPVRHAAASAGGTWTAGLAWGPLRTVCCADGQRRRAGAPVRLARALAARAAAGAVLADNAAAEQLRDDGAPDLWFGPRELVRGVQAGSVMDAHPIGFGAVDRPGARPGVAPKRVQGTVQRVDARRPTGFVLDEDGTFYYFDERCLVNHDALPVVGQSVWFSPRPPFQAGKNPIAAAIVGVGDVLDGTVLARQHGRAWVRATDRRGYYQDLPVRGSLEPGAQEGHHVRFHVIADPRGPQAADVRTASAEAPELELELDNVHDATVGDRFVAAVMLELRSRGASGAGASVRRATAGHRRANRETPRQRYERTLLLADHALRFWARRALQAAEAEASVLGLESLGHVQIAADAGYAEHLVGEYTTHACAHRSPWSEDPKPTLDRVRNALRHVARMGDDWDDAPAADESRLATEWAAKALAEAFLAGFVDPVGSEAAAVARKLEALR